jgi:hypothetical protein
MGTCGYCGGQFPLTRSTRKYCTPLCKTKACLDRKPSRVRAADVRALFDLLDQDDITSVDAFRERLRAIIAPRRQPIVQQDGPVAIPRLD